MIRRTTTSIRTCSSSATVTIRSTSSRLFVQSPKRSYSSSSRMWHCKVPTIGLLPLPRRDNNSILLTIRNWINICTITIGLLLLLQVGSIHATTTSLTFENETTGSITTTTTTTTKIAAMHLLRYRQDIVTNNIEPNESTDGTTELFEEFEEYEENDTIIDSMAQEENYDEERLLKKRRTHVPTVSPAPSKAPTTSSRRKHHKKKRPKDDDEEEVGKGIDVVKLPPPPKPTLKPTTKLYNAEQIALSPFRIVLNHAVPESKLRQALVDYLTNTMILQQQQQDDNDTRNMNKVTGDIIRLHPKSKANTTANRFYYEGTISITQLSSIKHKSLDDTTSSSSSSSTASILLLKQMLALKDTTSLKQALDATMSDHHGSSTTHANGNSTQQSTIDIIQIEVYSETDSSGTDSNGYTDSGTRNYPDQSSSSTAANEKGQEQQQSSSKTSLKQFFQQLKHNPTTQSIVIVIISIVTLLLVLGAFGIFGWYYCYYTRVHPQLLEIKKSNTDTSSSSSDVDGENDNYDKHDTTGFESGANTKESIHRFHPTVTLSVPTNGIPTTNLPPDMLPSSHLSNPMFPIPYILNPTLSALSSLQSSITMSRYKDFQPTDPNMNARKDDKHNNNDDKNDATSRTVTTPPMIIHTLAPLPTNDPTALQSSSVPLTQTKSSPPDITILKTVQDKNELNHSHDDPYWDTISIDESTIVTIT